jgi:DNA gyrase subunit A
VRGIRLAEQDSVVSLSVLRHVEATAEERAAYLKLASAKRRSSDEAEAPATAEDAEATGGEVTLTPEQAAAFEAAEELLLSVTDRGFGKRSSAYEYRTTGRGGQGITNISLTPRTGREVVATFPVRSGDHVMLVTDGGRLIRLAADEVRITGRSAMGVMLMRLEEGERITSCFPVAEEAGDADG